MLYFNFILFLFIIFANHLVDNAISLHVEAINNGELAQQEENTYQVTILIPDRDASYRLICTGSLISKDLVLSIAQCFVNDDGSFIEYKYLIMCGTPNWYYFPGTIVLIEKIYFRGGGSYHYMNNVAVSKLTESLNVINNPDLSLVNIPLSTDPFYEKEGRVSGYGYDSLILHWNARHTKLIRMSESSQHWLKYGVVQIRKQVHCKMGDTRIHPKRHFCGRTTGSRERNATGVCNNDGGSPLVIDNQVVGLAVTFREDCDDSKEGGNGYMKISFYAKFINSIISGTPLPNTLIHYNIPVHVANAAAAA